MEFGEDLGIFMVFLYAFGDLKSIYWEMRFRNLYRKVKRELEQKRFEGITLSFDKWKRMNPDEEMETYLAVRERVIDSISKTKIYDRKYDLAVCNQTEWIEYIIKKELLQIKNTRNKGRPIKFLKEDSFASLYKKINDDIIDTFKTTTTTNQLEPAGTTNQPSTIPSKSSSAHICWTCHLPGNSLLKCSGCKKARYCGETCYREDWERHREWCGKKGQRRKYAEMKDIENWERDEVD